MKIELSVEEIVYLQRLLKEHVEYFRILAGNAKCSTKNHEQQKFIDTLWKKLSTRNE